MVGPGEKIVKDTNRAMKNGTERGIVAPSELLPKVARRVAPRRWYEPGIEASPGGGLECAVPEGVEGAKGDHFDGVLRADRHAPQVGEKVPQLGLRHGSSAASLRPSFLRASRISSSSRWSP